MVHHVVMWKFRPGTEKQQAEFLERLQGLQGVIPQLRSCTVRRNTGAGNYDAVLLSTFDSFADLEAYRTDPRHQAVSALCKSMRESRASVDYET